MPSKLSPERVLAKGRDKRLLTISLVMGLASWAASAHADTGIEAASSRLRESALLADAAVGLQASSWPNVTRRHAWLSWMLARFESWDDSTKLLFLRAFESEAALQAARVALTRLLADEPGAQQSAPSHANASTQLPMLRIEFSQRLYRVFDELGAASVVSTRYWLFDDFDRIEEERQATESVALDCASELERVLYRASEPCRWRVQTEYPVLDEDFTWLRAAQPSLRIELELHPRERHLRDLRLQWTEQALTLLGLEPMLAVPLSFGEHTAWLLMAADEQAPSRRDWYDDERVVLVPTRLERERASLLAYRIMRAFSLSGEQARARLFSVDGASLIWIHFEVVGATPRLPVTSWLDALERAQSS